MVSVGSSSGSGNSDGPAVDRTGAPVIDPTKNVLDLFNASQRRADDLRAADEKLRDFQFAANQELRDAQIDHLKEVGLLRAEYWRDIGNKESDRIDAIRAVDVGAVARAAEVSGTQAATLATQQQASADALRGQVEQARIATADALAQALAPITKSVEDLRAAQYAQQGERSATVPIADQLAPLVEQIRTLSMARSQQTGAEGQQTQSRTQNNFALTATIGVVAVIVTIVIAYFSSQPTPTTTTILPPCASAAAGQQCLK